MRAHLDTLLIAVYCAACSLFPSLPEPKRRRGRPPKITDNELICLMVAQMLLGIPSERRFLPIAGWRLCHLFPRLPSQTTYNERCRMLAPKLVILWRAIACELPGFHDSLLLLDTTPLPCGQSTHTVNRSELGPYCAFGYSPAHSRFFWGMRLVLLTGADGTIVDFDLVPADMPEREAGLALLERQPLRGQLLLCDKGFAGREFERAVGELQALVVRPSRADEHDRAQRRSAGSGSASSRSCKRSKIRSASSATWPRHPPASPPGSSPASSRSAPLSTSTGNSAGHHENSSPTAINRSGI